MDVLLKSSMTANSLVYVEYNKLKCNEVLLDEKIEWEI